MITETTAAERAGDNECLLVDAWQRTDVHADQADIAQFCKEIAADHDRPRTTYERWSVLSRIQREIGAGRLADVTRPDVRRWWFGTGQMRADGAGLRGPATRQAMINHLRAYLRWSIAEGLRDTDPTLGIHAPRVPRREPRPAPKAEVDRVLAGARGSARTAIELASEVGLRACEIAVLMRDDLVQDEQGWWWLWLTRKGGHRLKCLVPAHLAVKLAKVPSGRPLVPGRTGSNLTARGVCRLVSRTFDRAGSPIRGHQLRHMAATQLLVETGGNLIAVRDQLGHASVTTTALYTQPNAADVHEALARRGTVRRPRRRRPNSTDKDTSR